MLAIKILGAIVAVVLVAVVGAALGMYFRLVPIPGPILALLVGAQPPEYSARYYPPDTLAYAWVTLAPGQGQIDDMQDIWTRFNEFRDFRRLVDDAREDFEDETGVDIETDVEPWIGPDASIAFIDFNFRREEPIIAATIRVRDGGAARDFLDQWLDYMEDSEGADFDRDSYKGFDTWSDENAYQVYALSEKLLVFATTDNGIEEVIDGIAGDVDRSLADSEKFQAAREALPERRFASFYVDYVEGIDLLEDFYPDEFGTISAETFGEQEPEWVAGSAGWSERAVIIETVLPLGIDHPLEFADLAEPARLLPDDTMGFAAGTFDPDVSNWRTALREYDLGDFVLDSASLEEINYGVAEIANGNPPELNSRDTIADVLDLGLWLVDDLTGIDLERDLFDHLAGEAIVAVSDVDFAAIERDPLSNTVDAIAMLSYREGSETGLTETMGEVADIIEENLLFFVDVDSVSMGTDADATVFHISADLAETNYAPGYVLYQGYLTVGTTEDALETIVDLQDGKGRSLASTNEYARIVGHLPEPRQALAYVNLQRIIGQFEPEDLEMTKDEYAILETSLGAVAIGAYSPHCQDFAQDGDCEFPGGAGVTRTTAAFTLFPE